MGQIYFPKEGYCRICESSSTQIPGDLKSSSSALSSSSKKLEEKSPISKRIEREVNKIIADLPYANKEHSASVVEGFLKGSEGFRTANSKELIPVVEKLREALIAHGIGKISKTIQDFISPVRTLHDQVDSCVLSFLDEKSLASMGMVSKSFQVSASNERMRRDKETIKRLNEGTSVKKLGFTEKTFLSFLERVSSQLSKEGSLSCRIKVLNLSSFPITAKGLAQIGKLSSLKELNLKDTRVVDGFLLHLKGLSSLESLNLGDCTHITDKGVDHLKGLKSLRALDLSYCDKVTDNGVRTIAQNLKQLKELWLIYCDKIHNLSLVHLKKLTCLEELYLDRCEGVTREGFLTLGDISSLKLLHLEDGDDLPLRDVRALVEKLPGLQVEIDKYDTEEESDGEDGGMVSVFGGDEIPAMLTQAQANMGVN